MASVTYTIDNLSDDSSEPIAEGTTDADGNFEAEVDETLVEEGDDLLITVGNMTLHVEYDGDSDGDGEFPAGECDLDSHMAWMDIRDLMDELGYADYSAVNFDEIDFGIDLGCYEMMAEHMWNDDDVTVTGDGIAGSAAIMEYVHAAAVMMGGFDPGAINDGELTDEQETALFDHIEDHFGINATTVTSAYDAAVAADNAIEDALALLAQSGVADGTSALFLEEGVDFCAEFEADPAQLEIMMDNFQDCGDPTELADLWGNEDSLVAYWDFHETVTDWSAFNQDAFLGSWASTVDTYGESDDWGNFDPSQFYDIYSYVATASFEDGGEADYYSYGMAYCGSYYEDVEAYYDGGGSGAYEFDMWYAETGEDMAGFWYGQVYSGFDATSSAIDYETYDWGTQFEDHADEYDYSACITDPAACAAYVPEVEGGYYYEAPPAGSEGEVAECGDYVCDYELGESSYSCSIDCGYVYTPPSTEGSTTDTTYSGYCGDGTCSDSESAYASCSYDCGGSSGTSTGTYMPPTMP